jgi:hypothetical protein
MSRLVRRVAPLALSHGQCITPTSRPCDGIWPLMASWTPYWRALLKVGDSGETRKLIPFIFSFNFKPSSLPACFNVYSDFMTYSSGIYVYDGKSSYLGGHCVELIGWGHDNSTKLDYWVRVPPFHAFLQKKKRILHISFPSRNNSSWRTAGELAGVWTAFSRWSRASTVATWKETHSQLLQQLAAANDRWFRLY